MQVLEKYVESIEQEFLGQVSSVLGCKIMSRNALHIPSVHDDYNAHLWAVEHRIPLLVRDFAIADTYAPLPERLLDSALEASVEHIGRMWFSQEFNDSPLYLVPTGQVRGSLDLYADRAEVFVPLELFVYGIYLDSVPHSFPISHLDRHHVHSSVTYQEKELYRFSRAVH